MTTQIVTAPGVQAGGRIGIRGWRVLCDCGYLSRVYDKHQDVTRAAHVHRLDHRPPVTVAGRV